MAYRDAERRDYSHGKCEGSKDDDDDEPQRCRRLRRPCHCPEARPRRCSTPLQAGKKPGILRPIKNWNLDTLMMRVIKEQGRSDYLILAVPRHGGGDARRGLLLAPPNGGDPRQAPPPAPQEADDPAAARRRPGLRGSRGAVAALGCDGEEEAAAEAE